MSQVELPALALASWLAPGMANPCLPAHSCKMKHAKGNRGVVVIRPGSPGPSSLGRPLLSVLLTRPWSLYLPQEPPTCTPSNPLVLTAPPSFRHSPLSLITLSANSSERQLYVRSTQSPRSHQLRASGQWAPGMQVPLHSRVQPPARLWVCPQA